MSCLLGACSNAKRFILGTSDKSLVYGYFLSFFQIIIIIIFFNLATRPSSSLPVLPICLLRGFKAKHKTS